MGGEPRESLHGVCGPHAPPGARWPPRAGTLPSLSSAPSSFAADSGRGQAAMPGRAGLVPGSLPRGPALLLLASGTQGPARPPHSARLRARGAACLESPRPAAASGPRAWSGAGPPSAFSPHRRPAGVRSRPARSACRSLARASLPSFVTDAMSVFCTLCISAVSDAPGCVGDVPDGQVVPRKFCDAIYLCFPMSRAGHTGSDFPSPDTRSAVGGRRHLAAPCARMRLGVRTVAVGGWPPPAPLRRQRPRRPRRLFSRAWAFGGSRGDGAPLCCGKRGFLVSGCFLGDCPPQ